MTGSLSQTRGRPEPWPIRFAYADPPYLGCGQKHYGYQHEAAADYDDPNAHYRLIQRLEGNYPAWALSCSTPTLHTMLRMCEEIIGGMGDIRVGAWVKPFASFKPNVNPAFCWEPVIFFGGRKRGRDLPTARDYVEANITMQRGTSGAKPDAFSFWLFEFLGVRADDEFHDLFPGSGAVSRAWKTWSWHNAPVAALSPADDGGAR